MRTLHVQLVLLYRIPAYLFVHLFVCVNSLVTWSVSGSIMSRTTLSWKSVSLLCRKTHTPQFLSFHLCYITWPHSVLVSLVLLNTKSTYTSCFLMKLYVACVFSGTTLYTLDPVFSHCCQDNGVWLPASRQTCVHVGGRIQPEATGNAVWQEFLLGITPCASLVWGGLMWRSHVGMFSLTYQTHLRLTNIHCDGMQTELVTLASYYCDFFTTSSLFSYLWLHC